MSESRLIPESQANFNPNLPVPAHKDYQAGVLAGLLFYLEPIANDASKIREAKAQLRSINDERYNYVPQFANDIKSSLDYTTALLLGAGYIRKNTNPATGFRAERKSMPNNPAREIWRSIVWHLHPDRQNPGEEEAKEASKVIDEVTRASEKGDFEEAQSLYFETIPPHLFQRIKGVLERGATFEDIIQRNPLIVAEIQKIRYIALKRSLYSRNYGRPNLPSAERSLVLTKSYRDKHARLIAMDYVDNVFSDIVDFSSGMIWMEREEIKKMYESFKTARDKVETVDDHTDHSIEPRVEEEEEHIRTISTLLHGLAYSIISGDVEKMDEAISTLRSSITQVDEVAGKIEEDFEERFTALTSYFEERESEAGPQSEPKLGLKHRIRNLKNRLLRR